MPDNAWELLFITIIISTISSIIFIAMFTIIQEFSKNHGRRPVLGDIQPLGQPDPKDWASRSIRFFLEWEAIWSHTVSLVCSTRRYMLYYSSIQDDNGKGTSPKPFRYIFHFVSSAFGSWFFGFRGLWLRFSGFSGVMVCRFLWCL